MLNKVKYVTIMIGLLISFIIILLWSKLLFIDNKDGLNVLLLPVNLYNLFIYFSSVIFFIGAIFAIKAKKIKLDTFLFSFGTIILFLFKTLTC